MKLFMIILSLQGATLSAGQVYQNLRVTIPDYEISGYPDSAVKNAVAFIYNYDSDSSEEAEQRAEIFLRAILDEDIERMAELITYDDHNANSVDEYGRTRLIWAAKLGKPRSLKFLLALGVNIDIVDRKGYTFLDYCYHQTELMAAIGEHNTRVLLAGFCGKYEPVLVQDRASQPRYRIKRYSEPVVIRISENYKKADVDLENRLYCAIEKADKDLIEQLKKEGAQFASCRIQQALQKKFFAAVNADDQASQKYWVALGADPEEVDMVTELSKIDIQPN